MNSIESFDRIHAKNEVATAIREIEFQSAHLNALLKYLRGSTFFPGCAKKAKTVLDAYVANVNLIISDLEEMEKETMAVRSQMEIQR